MGSTFGEIIGESAVVAGDAAAEASRIHSVVAAAYAGRLAQVKRNASGSDLGIAQHRRALIDSLRRMRSICVWFGVSFLRGSSRLLMMIPCALGCTKALDRWCACALIWRE